MAWDRAARGALGIPVTIAFKVQTLKTKDNIAFLPWSIKRTNVDLFFLYFVPINIPIFFYIQYRSQLDKTLLTYARYLVLQREKIKAPDHQGPASVMMSVREVEQDSLSLQSG